MTSIITDSEIKKLHDETGASLYDCRLALEYEKEHAGCTAMGYIKAKCYAVATPKLSFEDRVKKFSIEK